MTGVDMAFLNRFLPAGLVLMAVACPLAPTPASGAAPADLRAPAGYRLIAEIGPHGDMTIIQGRVCRTSGAAVHRPQAVRFAAAPPGGAEQALGWTGLSRPVAVRDTGCAFFSYRFSGSLPDAPLRIVAF